MPRSPQIPPWLWITMVLVGIIGLQVVFRKSPEARKPGRERGDIELTDNVLPDELAGWKKVKFLPPKGLDELPDGQFWWSFAWLYTNERQTALVAFDQADWIKWHELTVCYQAAGWELNDRRIDAIYDQKEGTQVLASFEMMPGPRLSTVVFSLFDQDGALLESPVLGVKKARAPAADRAASRLTFQLPESVLEERTQNFAKVMQAQVFTEHSEPLSEQDERNIRDLHMASLVAFQQAYLRTLNNP